MLVYQPTKPMLVAAGSDRIAPLSGAREFIVRLKLPLKRFGLVSILSIWDVRPFIPVRDAADAM